MNELVIWIGLSLCILVLGIFAAYFVIRYYGEKLLYNFSRKIWMTLFLGAAYTLLFFLGNGILVYTFKRTLFLDDFNLYLQNLWFLIRVGLAFFILNSFLIVAFRSVIKTLYEMHKL